MVKKSKWEYCSRPVFAAAVFVLLILCLFTPALTSENTPPPDRSELNHMLKDACGQCHNLNRVILETGSWNLKDWMHAFNKMAKTSGLTRTEKAAVANYVDTHRQEIELEQHDEQDRPDSMSIGTYYVLFENRCVVCHDAEMIDRVPVALDREDLRHIVDRMVEKAPHFLDGVNKENIVNHLDKSNAATDKVGDKPGDA